MTPFNVLGTAPTSESRDSFLMSAVKPALRQDLLSLQPCQRDKILHFLIGRLNVPADDAAVVLEKSLAHLTGVLCSPSFKTVRENLQSYSKAQSETARYDPFVRAANQALVLMKEDVVLTQLLGGSSQDDILFWRNDPDEMTGVLKPGETHPVQPSRRKPDVPLLRCSALKFMEAENLALSEVMDMLAPLHPQLRKTDTKFTPAWPDTLLCAEFKFICKKLLFSFSLAPPSRESSIPPMTVEEALREDDNDQPISVSVDSGSKRSGGALLPESEAKRRKLTAQTQTNARLKKQPIAVQLASYAAEKMASPAVASAINLLISDANLHVWYYDHQGIIQSDGICLLTETPYFLVLLAIFQRLDAAGWGMIPELAASFDGAVFSCEDGPDIAINSGDCHRSHYGIVGRGTQVYGATATSVKISPAVTMNPREARASKRHAGNPSTPSNDPDAEDVSKMVIKISHPEGKRCPEQEFIKKAQLLQDEDIKGHLPVVFGAREFTMFSTEAVRLALGLPTDGWRAPRVIVFERLYELPNLSDDDLWLGIWKLVRCHYRLWHNGIEHGDISLSNLMYRKGPENTVVLNDFDLARNRDDSSQTGQIRTGTLAFMAVQLLTAEGISGEIPRSYRHDLESFLWVTLWVLYRYSNGRLILDPPFNAWGRGNEDSCRSAKIDPYDKQSRAVLADTPAEKRTRMLCVHKILDGFLDEYRKWVRCSRDQEVYTAWEAPTIFAFLVSSGIKEVKDLQLT
ncbi:hypothetical protein C8R47DRAFT_1090255 [Mycena vitilis]|nr:hypothetical protein C8R47DRAFT_1090255 [Mycena vitilis]